MTETGRLTLREAADIIGIPLDSLRKRVYRGTIPAQKVDGQYFVLLSDAKRLSPADKTPGETVLGHGVRQGETSSDNEITRELLDQLKSENEFLRSQLLTLNYTIQELTQKIPNPDGGLPTMIETGQFHPSTKPASPDGPGREQVTSSTHSPLGRRLRFWRRGK